MFKYRAIITNICDNELVDVAIDLGFGIVSNQKIKLAGIDSTEFRDKKDSTRALALKIKLAELLLNKEVTVKSLKAEKSGRYLAFFYLDNNQKSINDILVETGFAKSYVKKEIK